MKNIFLDANILIDYLENRETDYDLDKIFENNSGFELYISALTIHIIYYVLKIKYNSNNNKVIKLILNRVHVLPLTEIIIKGSIETEYFDFEDMLQFQSAINYCDTILTRDKKDFLKIKKLLNSNINIINKI